MEHILRFTLPWVRQFSVPRERPHEKQSVLLKGLEQTPVLDPDKIAFGLRLTKTWFLSIMSRHIIK